MRKQVLGLAMAAFMAVFMVACSKSAEETNPAVTQGEETTTGDTVTENTVTEGTTEADNTDGGVLIMVTNAEFPPYEFREGDQIVGIDVEIAQAIAAKMGMTLEIEDIAFDSIIPALQSGKADMALAGMTVREDRLVNVDFSTPYTKASQVIIVTEDSEISVPDDLKGKLIGVQLGTTGDIYVSDFEADGSEIDRYSKGFEAVQALIQGKVDAVVIDQEPAKVFVSQNDGLKILDEALTVEEYAIAVKKGNVKLLENINSTIDELKASGELQAIVDKYISAE